MNTSPRDVKQFFVFQNEENLGPFSRGEIELKLDDGTLSNEDFFWTEELNGWHKLGEFEDCLPVSKVSTDQWPQKTFQRPQATRVWPMDAILAPPATTLPKNAPLVSSASKLRLRKYRGHYALGLLTLTLTFLLLRSEFIRQTNNQNLSIIKGPLNEIELEEGRELRSAISEPISESGPSLAIAVANRTSPTPYFLVGSNLPDGSRFDILIEGITDTLLGQLQISELATVTIKAGSAKSVPFQLIKNGVRKNIPMGEYHVTVVNSANQPTKTLAALSKWIHLLKNSETSRIRTQKTYFLGGRKDEEYDRKLKKYHEDLRLKAQNEVLELDQFVNTLEDQLTQSTTMFQSLAQDTMVKPRNSKWSDFDRPWTDLQDKLNASLEKWTPEWLKENTLYQNLYLSVKKAGQLVNLAHQYQSAYFATSLSNSTDPADQNLEIQAAESSSLAQSTLLSLKSQIQLIKKLPETSNGMPHIPNLAR